MERREFLQYGAVSGLGGVAGSSCVSLGRPLNGSPAAATERVDMDAYVAGLDRVMEAIGTGGFFRELFAAENPGRAFDDVGRREVLARKAVRTLTLTGMFLDLSEEDRAHPAMQSRMWAAMGEMDEAVTGVADWMERSPPTARAELRSRLQRDPDTAMRLAETLDAECAAIGVPAKRRGHLRRLTAQVGWRLRNQDPSLLMDEFVDKVRRTTAQAQAAARTEPPPQQSAQRAPWATSDPQRSDTEQAATAASPTAQGDRSSGQLVSEVEETLGVAPTTSGARSAGPNTPRRGRGQGTVTAGLIVMGIGLGLGGIGGLIVAAGSFAGAFFLTAGALGLLGGLITLIVGGLLNATE